MDQFYVAGNRFSKSMSGPPCAEADQACQQRSAQRDALALRRFAADLETLASEMSGSCRTDLLDLAARQRKIAALGLDLDRRDSPAADDRRRQELGDALMDIVNHQGRLFSSCVQSS